MKKNYIEPNIKMAIAIETEDMIATSLTVDNSEENKIESSEEILSRHKSVWDDEE